MKLYCAPGTVSLAVLIALEEANARYEPILLDFKQNAQRTAEYKAVNPKARVPSLETEHGILTETPAILTYIAQTYPAAKLAPSDPFAYARMQEFNAYLCGTAHVAHAHRMRGARWSDDPAVWENLKLKVPQNMAEIFTLIETTMFQCPWVLGDAYSTSDPYLFTLECWMESDSVKIADFPTLHDHYQRMNDRPAVVRAMAKLAG